MRNKFFPVSVLALTFLLAPRAAAEEGMWTFDNFPAARMQSELGWAPDRAWLERVMGATVRLPTCSGVNVSAEGLVLTNQHCVVACLTQLSSPERNYFTRGFAAREREQEARCPGLAVDVLEAIVDVTARVEAAAGAADAEAFVRVRDAEIAAIEGECAGPARCEVTTLYEGARYRLYRFARYDDVRLVFAPEYQMAQFGGEADNFQFPRTCVDFAFVRLYRDGAPASTSRHLDLRFTAPAEGEIVLVSGNPGVTSRFKTAAELAFERDVTTPWRQAALQDAHARIAAYAALGAEEARAAAAVLETVANDAEAYAGRRLALANAAGMARVDAAQADLQARVTRNLAAQREVGDAWGEVARAQTEYRQFFYAYQYGELRAGERSALFAWARDIVRGGRERAKPEASRLPRYAPPRLAQIERWVRAPRPVRADWEGLNLTIWLEQLARFLPPENPDLARRILGGQAPEDLAERLAASRLAEAEYRTHLWEGGAAAVDASDDPMIVFVRAWDEAARAVATRYHSEVAAPVARAHERIARVRFRAFGEAIYPEATFSPRLSYGRVSGWTESGRDIGPFTRIADLYAAPARGNAYQLTPIWRNGQSRLDPQMVVNLTSSNDILSGNSGSALIDRDGRVVGVVFDGNIHALGGEYYYDGALNRTVSVSSAVIRAALGLYAMSPLADELAHPSPDSRSEVRGP